MTNQHVPIPLPLTRHVHVMLHPLLMGETTVIHTTRAVSTSMCKPTTQAKEARGVPRAPRPAPRPQILLGKRENGYSQSSGRRREECSNKKAHHFHTASQGSWIPWSFNFVVIL